MGTLSQTVAPLPRLYESAILTMPTASGTVEGISIPANCVVIGAWAEVTTSEAGSTTHVFDISVGSADIATALVFAGASDGDVLIEAFVPVAVTAADTIDIVSTVTGTGTAGAVKLFALVVDTSGVGSADEVDRDQLA